jgi:anti-sigma regulatory factor (Ser/Thr protein kinase)
MTSCRKAVIMKPRYIRSMRELRVQADTENLPEVLGFVDGVLEELDCPMKVQLQIDVAVEELFVNISRYAYAGGQGDAVIGIEVPDDHSGVSVTFKDNGIPFDPVSHTDPDISLSADEREIGGLGILMVRKSMNSMEYEYTDGTNILTITKLF